MAKDETEITGINVQPVENGCVVTVRTKTKTTRKDGYDYGEKQYTADADTFNNILETIGVEISEEVEEGGEKPKIIFDAKKFK